jgi:hypothetical protein
LFGRGYGHFLWGVFKGKGRAPWADCVKKRSGLLEFWRVLKAVAELFFHIVFNVFTFSKILISLTLLALSLAFRASRACVHELVF